MSIRNLRLFGDMNATPGCWWPSDAELLLSQSGVKKIHEAYRKTPFDFNFNVVIDSKCGPFGAVDYIKKQRSFDDLIDPTAINVAYSNNVTNASLYIPMNAWILAHRLGHTFQVDRQIENDFWEKLVPSMTELAGKIHSGDFGRDSNRTYGIGEKDTSRTFGGPGSKFNIADYEPGRCILQLLMTMRSCRTLGTLGQLEYFCELMAQFIITGKITLRRYVDWDAQREMIGNTHPRAKLYYNETRDVREFIPYQERCSLEHVRKILCLDIDSQHKPEAIDALVGQIEQIMNDEMHSVLQGMVGKLSAF